MTGRIDELLGKLRKLDPATRERIRENDHYQRDDPTWLWMIQGVIQDAIAARGWDFQVGQFQAIPLASAMIWIASDEDGIGRRGGTAADALLAAYVAALEAEAAR